MAIDLNSDLGERPEAQKQDALILASITSASLACGFHAGDPETMRFFCEGAAAACVVVGAHVSYRDREGFGRREVEIEPERLTADTLEQLQTLEQVARGAGTRVAYIKPHGALYHRCSWDAEQAAAVIAGTERFGGELKVLGLPGSKLLELAAERGLEAVAEGYADRRYRADGGLVQRDRPGAILAGSQAVEQARRLASDDDPAVRSLCLHGDHPGAVELARLIRAELERAGIELRAFA